MSQIEIAVPGGGGLAVRTRIEQVVRALGSCSKGGTAPPAPLDGQVWLDDSGDPWAVKQYAGGWRPLYTLSPSTGVVTFPEQIIEGVDYLFTSDAVPGPTGVRRSIRRLFGVNQAGFGDTQDYLAYGSFDDTPEAWGWSFVAGTSGGPPHGSTQGGWRCRVSTGMGNGQQALELAIARGAAGGDPTALWTRQALDGVFGSWGKVSAGNADTVGGLGIAALGHVKKWVNYNQATNTVGDSVGVSSVTDHGTGQFTVDFTTPFSSASYAPSGMSKGDDGYIEAFAVETANAPRWDASGIRLAHKTTGDLVYVDCSPGGLIFAGAV